MIASHEINTHIALKVCHGALLLFFGVKLVFAGIQVFKLRSLPDTYQARLFTFGYLSFSAWILWVVQYAILAAPFLPFPSGASLETVLWLGVVQNVFWACAALALHVKFLSRKLLTLPFLAVVSVAVALLAYQTEILSVGPLTPVTLIDAVFGGAIFVAIGISLSQLDLSKTSIETFLVHGSSQWVWRLLWLNPVATTAIVQFAFPVWRILLFFIWTTALSRMAKRAQPVEQKLAQLPPQTPRAEIPLQRTPNLQVTLKVMISSTVEDLIPEREAADRAIRALKLTRFRAETLGSFPHPPEVICAFMAEQCDIFVLIIGERYGYTIKSKEKSVVEFEYEIARRQNRGKILVYIKDGVTREPGVDDFVKRVEDFEEGHFRSLFKTPEELFEMLQGDITRLILLLAAEKRPQSFDSPPNSH